MRSRHASMSPLLSASSRADIRHVIISRTSAQGPASSCGPIGIVRPCIWQGTAVFVWQLAFCGSGGRRREKTPAVGRPPVEFERAWFTRYAATRYTVDMTRWCRARTTTGTSFTPEQHPVSFHTVQAYGGVDTFRPFCLGGG